MTSRPYTIETFTVHAAKKELYGRSKQIVHYSDGWYDIRVYEFHDGDEGGLHVVTAYFTDPLLHDVSPSRPLSASSIFSSNSTLR